MHVPRIYIQQTLEENATIELDAKAAHHIVTVMRMKVGRDIILFNGELYQGGLGEFRATLAYVDKKNVCVAVGKFTQKQSESPLVIELGACLIKNDRMDWLLQKATELGVTSISPLWSEYTDVKIPADRVEKKWLHWQKIVINACEQSGRTSIPIIHKPQKIHTWCEHVSADKKVVLHPYTQVTKDTTASYGSIALLVGPEGGLTEEEVALSGRYGFQTMALGPRILRAETAPLAALSLLQYQFGDF